MPAKRKPAPAQPAVTVSSSWPAAEQAIPERLVTQTKAVPAEGSPPSASPQLLERTFAMLSLFAADQPEWTTTELSSVSGLPVPTTHRIVVALQRHGFLVRDPATKRFRQS